MATVAAVIERHIRETNDGFRVSPADANALFDDAVLQYIDSAGAGAIRSRHLPPSQVQEGSLCILFAKYQAHDIPLHPNLE